TLTPSGTQATVQGMPMTISVVYTKNQESSPPSRSNGNSTPPGGYPLFLILGAATVAALAGVGLGYLLGRRRREPEPTPDEPAGGTDEGDLEPPSG
ncbi:MAG: hypothetical protein L3J97_08005, partial [Thermoplasmata archaeon]|nr:hypothetical protein [Thermoplasmata archaeon]